MINVRKRLSEDELLQSLPTTKEELELLLLLETAPTHVTNAGMELSNLKLEAAVNLVKISGYTKGSTP
jgi:hypothetical protein